MKRTQVMLLMIGLLTMPLLGQTPQKIAGINKKVVGKWVSVDRKSYIEFSVDGSCSTGELGNDGAWHVDHNVLDAPWSQSDDFTCGNGGLTLTGPNVLIRDYGMGGEPEKFYRGSANLPKPVGALTLIVAQRILSQEINAPMPNNTIYTCHACYDPGDKEDNEKAPIVTSYSSSLGQFLMNHGYIRTSGEQTVFTAKAKRSKYFEVDKGGMAGLRFASFRNPIILTSKITDPKHVPIEYDLVPTDVTIGFFGKVQRVKSFASFSYENEAWRVCIACSR